MAGNISLNMHKSSFGIFDKPPVCTLSPEICVNARHQQTAVPTTGNKCTHHGFAERDHLGNLVKQRPAILEFWVGGAGEHTGKKSNRILERCGLLEQMHGHVQPRVHVFF